MVGRLVEIAKRRNVVSSTNDSKWWRAKDRPLSKVTRYMEEDEFRNTSLSIQFSFSVKKFVSIYFYTAHISYLL